MPWDDKIVALPTAFTDMLDAPQTSDEVALRGGAITIPANGVIDLSMAAREPSSTVPTTVTVFVNGIQYSEVTDMANLVGNTFFVNYAASRVRFATTEAGKQVTKLEYQNWGTQNRAKHVIDAYEAVKAIRTVAKAFFDALEANSKLQIKLTATTLDLLNSTYPPAQYAGADAYVAGVRYYSNGTNWIKFEDIVTSGTVPVVTQITPAANAVNVNKASVVSIKFNQNMNGDDLLTRLTVKNKNGAALLGTFEFRDKNGQAVASSSTKIREVLFTPTAIADPSTAATAAAVTDATPYSTLPAGTYFVTYVWVTAAGQTLPCATRASVTIAAGQRLTVQVPAFPTNVTAADVYIGTVSGSETKQGTINTTGGTYSQSVALAAGAALPTENTTALAIATSPFYVELLPSENIVGTVMAATFTSAFSCASDMLPTAATISVTNVGGDRCDVNMVTPGSDFEGAVVYDIYIRNVTQGGAFTLVTGQSGLTAFPRTVTGLNTSTNYEITVRTRDTAGQTVDSNIVAFQTSGVIDAIPSAPDAALINITGISTTGYTVQLATANQPTDPDNPAATITFDIADGTTGNIVATGVTSAQMNAGYAVTANHAIGTSFNVYVRAVSSTSGAGSWGAAKLVTVPTNNAPTVTVAAATNISTSGFTANGTVSNADGPNVTQVEISYAASAVSNPDDASATKVLRTGKNIADGGAITEAITATLGAGDYKYWIRAYDPQGGWGGWSVAQAFTVTSYVFEEYFTAANGSAPDATKWNNTSYGTTLTAGSTFDIQNNKLTAVMASTANNSWNGKGIVTKTAISLGAGRTINATLEGLPGINQCGMEICIAPTTWTGNAEDMTNFVKLTLNNGLFVIKKNAGTRTVLFQDTTTAAYKTGTKTFTIEVTATNFVVKDGVTTVTTQAHGLDISSGFYLGVNFNVATTTQQTNSFDTITVA